MFTDPEKDIKVVDTVISMLSSRKMPQEGRAFETALKWVESFPGHIDSERKSKLLSSIVWCFDIEEKDIYAKISGFALPTPHTKKLVGSEEEFNSHIPATGWLRSYVEYTRYCEAPMPYHAFTSLVLLGASLGRKVRFESGHFNTYPNLCVLLIGPPGRLKKSTCVGIAKKLVARSVLCPVFPDKCTPESLIGILQKGPHVFIGAPELSFFLGKQKYNEGLVVTLLRLLDTEDYPIDVSTLTRGEQTLENVVLSMIGGSTMSLFTESTADQVASSGFLSRFLTLVEDDTPRCFSTARKGELKYENEILLTLDYMKERKGSMVFAPDAAIWYDQWYRRRWERMRTIQDDTLVQVQERGAEHMKRISMILHLADHKDHYICVKCLEQADWLLSYAEKSLPKLVSGINHNVKSGEMETILDYIRRAGGAIDHSKLLRGLSSRGVDANTLKTTIQTLKERGQVHEEKRGAVRFYIIREIA